MSPLLFSMVAEGLIALVRRVVNSDIMRWFKINDKVSYSLLQFADDIMLMCDGSWFKL